MKLSEFILLDEEQKKSAVVHEGVLIAKRRYPDTMVFLFQLGSYYVETWFNSVSKKVLEFRISEETDILNPYLEEMSLDDILGNKGGAG